MTNTTTSSPDTATKRSGDLFEGQAGKRSIDVNHDEGVFDPSFPSPDIYSPRYGIKLDPDKPHGHMVGDEGTGSQKLRMAIEVGALAPLGIMPGAELLHPELVDGVDNPEGRDYWNYAWADALALKYQDSTVWGRLVVPAQDEWNRRHPEAQPGGGASGTFQGAKHPSSTDTATQEPAAQVPTGAVTILTGAANEALRELHEQLGGKPGGKWAAELKRLADLVKSTLGA